MEHSELYTWEEYLEIMRRLRAKDGCPWDSTQTHESLRNCVIEEAYETADAIDTLSATQNSDNLVEELGDLLLQVVLQSLIGEEEGLFSLDTVIDSTARKMIRRHPHVFGKSGEEMPAWEEVKKKEHGEETISQGMERVAAALPALIRAEKVQKKAEDAGFSYEKADGVFEKVLEEWRECREAAEKTDQSHLQEEIGDLLFAVVSLARFFGLNAENSLTNATNKFISRFKRVEKAAADRELILTEIDRDTWMKLWDLARQGGTDGTQESS